MTYLMMIFVMHYIADFWLQTEWMALGKSKSLKPLLAHIAVYTTVCFVIGMLFMPIGIAFAYAIINGACHFVVDYFSSRAMRAAKEANNTRKFYLILGFDQLLHAQCLIGTLGLLL